MSNYKDRSDYELLSIVMNAILENELDTEPTQYEIEIENSDRKKPDYISERLYTPLVNI